jgi:tetratricopeptide (TPR) repeat protein
LGLPLPTHPSTLDPSYPPPPPPASHAEALERIDIALKRNPQAWAVLEARGRILQELDRHKPAVLALQEALHNLDPEEPMAVTARLHYAIAQVCCGHVYVAPL